MSEISSVLRLMGEVRKRNKVLRYALLVVLLLMLLLLSGVCAVTYGMLEATKESRVEGGDHVMVASGTRSPVQTAVLVETGGVVRDQSSGAAARVATVSSYATLLDLLDLPLDFVDSIDALTFTTTDGRLHRLKSEGLELLKGADGEPRKLIMHTGRAGASVEISRDVALLKTYVPETQQYEESLIIIPDEEEAADRRRRLLGRPGSDLYLRCSAETGACLHTFEEIFDLHGLSEDGSMRRLDGTRNSIGYASINADAYALAGSSGYVSWAAATGDTVVAGDDDELEEAEGTASAEIDEFGCLVDETIDTLAYPLLPHLCYRWYSIKGCDAEWTDGDGNVRTVSNDIGVGGGDPHTVVPASIINSGAELTCDDIVNGETLPGFCECGGGYKILTGACAASGSDARTGFTCRALCNDIHSPYALDASAQEMLALPLRMSLGERDVFFDVLESSDNFTSFVRDDVQIAARIGYDVSAIVYTAELGVFQDVARVPSTFDPIAQFLPENFDQWGASTEGTVAVESREHDLSLVVGSTDDKMSIPAVDTYGALTVLDESFLDCRAEPSRCVDLKDDVAASLGMGGTNKCSVTWDEWRDTCEERVRETAECTSVFSAYYQRDCGNDFYGIGSPATFTEQQCSCWKAGAGALEYLDTMVFMKSIATEVPADNNDNNNGGGNADYGWATTAGNENYEQPLTLVDNNGNSECVKYGDGFYLTTTSSKGDYLWSRGKDSYFRFGSQGNKNRLFVYPPKKKGDEDRYSSNEQADWENECVLYGEPVVLAKDNRGTFGEGSGGNWYGDAVLTRSYHSRKAYPQIPMFQFGKTGTTPPTFMFMKHGGTGADKTGIGRSVKDDDELYLMELQDPGNLHFGTYETRGNYMLVTVARQGEERGVVFSDATRGDDWYAGFDSDCSGGAKLSASDSGCPGDVHENHWVLSMTTRHAHYSNLRDAADVTVGAVDLAAADLALEVNGVEDKEGDFEIAEIAIIDLDHFEGSENRVHNTLADSVATIGEYYYRKYAWLFLRAHYKAITVGTADAYTWPDSSAVGAFAATTNRVRVGTVNLEIVTEGLLADESTITFPDGIFASSAYRIFFVARQRRSSSTDAFLRTGSRDLQTCFDEQLAADVYAGADGGSSAPWREWAVASCAMDASAGLAALDFTADASYGDFQLLELAVFDGVLSDAMVDNLVGQLKDRHQRVLSETGDGTSVVDLDMIATLKGNVHGGALTEPISVGESWTVDAGVQASIGGVDYLASDFFRADHDIASACDTPSAASDIVTTDVSLAVDQSNRNGVFSSSIVLLGLAMCRAVSSATRALLTQPATDFCGLGGDGSTNPTCAPPELVVLQTGRGIEFKWLPGCIFAKAYQIRRDRYTFLGADFAREEGTSGMSATFCETHIVPGASLVDTDETILDDIGGAHEYCVRSVIPLDSGTYVSDWTCEYIEIAWRAELSGSATTGSPAFKNVAGMLVDTVVCDTEQVECGDFYGKSVLAGPESYLSHQLMDGGYMWSFSVLANATLLDTNGALGACTVGGAALSTGDVVSRESGTTGFVPDFILKLSSSHALAWYAESPQCFLHVKDVGIANSTVNGTNLDSFEVAALGRLEVPAGGLGSFAYHFRVVREPSWQYMAVHCRDACGLASEDFALNDGGSRNYMDPRSAAFCGTWAHRCPDASLALHLASASQRGAVLFGSDTQDQRAVLCDPYAAQYAFYDAASGYKCCNQVLPSGWDTCERRFTSCDAAAGAAAYPVSGQADALKVLVQTAFEAEGSAQRMAYEQLDANWLNIEDIEFDGDHSEAHSVGIVPDLSAFGMLEAHLQHHLCFMVDSEEDVGDSGRASDPILITLHPDATLSTNAGLSLSRQTGGGRNQARWPANTLASETWSVSITFRCGVNDPDAVNVWYHLLDAFDRDAELRVKFNRFRFICNPSRQKCQWVMGTVFTNGAVEEYRRVDLGASVNFLDDGFHQATVVFSSQEILFYYDGEVANRRALRTDERFAAPELYRDSSNLGHVKYGTVDVRHVDIFDVALDNDEVRQLYRDHLGSCLTVDGDMPFATAREDRLIIVGHSWIGDAEKFFSTRTDSEGRFAMDLVLEDGDAEAYRDVTVLPFAASEFSNANGSVDAFFHDIEDVDAGEVKHRGATDIVVTDTTAVILSVHVDFDGVRSPEGCPAPDVLVCAYLDDGYESTSLDCEKTDAAGDASLSVPAGADVYVRGGCSTAYAAEDLCEELGEEVRTELNTYFHKVIMSDGSELAAVDYGIDDIVDETDDAVVVVEDTQPAYALVSAVDAEAGTTVYFRDASSRTLAVDLLAGRGSNTTDVVDVDRSMAWHLSDDIVSSAMLFLTADAANAAQCSVLLTAADSSVLDIGGETLTFSIPSGLGFTADLSFNTSDASAELESVAAFLDQHFAHSIAAGASHTRIYYNYRTPATVTLALSQKVDGSDADPASIPECNGLYSVSRFSDSGDVVMVYVKASVAEVYSSQLVNNAGGSATLGDLEGTVTAADSLAAGTPDRRLVRGVEDDGSDAYETCSASACEIDFGVFAATPDGATSFRYEILQLGLPESESPYTKTVQAFFTPSEEDVGSSTLVDLLVSDVASLEIVVVGDVPLSNFETIKLPEYVPFLILRDPPGGGSTASWEKGSSFTVAVEDSEVLGHIDGHEGQWGIGFEGKQTMPYAPFPGVPAKVIDIESETHGHTEHSLGYADTTVKGRTITITASETITTSPEIDTSGDSGDLFVVPSLCVLTTRVLPIRFDATACAGYEMSEQTTWQLLAGAFTNEKTLTETLKEYSAVQHAVVAGDDGEDNELEPVVGKVKTGELTKAERYRLKTLAREAIEDDSSWNSLTVHNVEDVLAVRIPQLQARCQEEFYRLLCHGSSFTYEGEFKDHIRDQLPEGALDSYVDEMAAAYASWCAFSTTSSSGLTCASYAAFDADGEDIEGAAIWRLEAAIMGISGWRYTLTLNEQLKDSSVALTRKQLASAPTKGSNFEQTSDLKFSNLENQFFDANGKPSGGAEGGFRGDLGLMQGGDSSAELSSIAFSGGGAEFSYTVETEVAKSIDVGQLIEFDLSGGFGFQTHSESWGLANKEFAATFGLKTEHDKHTEKERASTTVVTFTLTDGDANDYFDVGVSMDPVYGTPVFKTLAGRSSCPHEAHTDSIEVFSIEYPGVNELDMSGLSANRHLRDVVRPAGASPGTCASFTVEVTNESVFGDSEDLELEVRPPLDEEISGLSFRARGSPFYGSFTVPTISPGEVRKFRIDVCPHEDERDFALRGARFANAGVAKDGAVYCNVQIVLGSACEKAMRGSLSKISRYDASEMASCDDYDFRATFPNTNGMCWNTMLDGVFDDGHAPYRFADEAIVENAVTIRCLSFNTTTDACADNPCG